MRTKHEPILALVAESSPRATVLTFVGYAEPYSTPEECAQGPGGHGAHRRCWLCSGTRAAGARRWNHEMGQASGVVVTADMPAVRLVTWTPTS